jgi:hypothetical protein
VSVERAANTIKERQRALEKSVFGCSTWEEFLKLKGQWQGLADTLAILADEARKEGVDD